MWQFSCRSYISPTETDLYYLQSRYYNPEWGRFINADAYATTGQGLLGNNMFAYCLNNPVRYTDRDGEAADSYQGMAGEAIAVFFYELFTGNTHPSRQTQQLETEIIVEQNKMLVEFVKSDDFTKVKSGYKLASGIKDITSGVAVLLLPDPTLANELIAVRKVTFGIIKVTWGFVEFLGEVVNG